MTYERASTAESSQSADGLLKLFDFALLRTVTRGLSSDSFSICAKALVPLLTHQQLGWTFLNTLLNSEVELTQQEECLFREETVASKVVSEFVHRFGSSYLKETVLPCVQQLADSCSRSRKSYEVDPVKLQALQPELSPSSVEKSIQKSRLLLSSQVENFLSSIFNSTKFLPVPMVILCKQLADAVSLKYFNRRTTALSGLMFLRFICPSLLTMNLSDICKDSTHEAKTRRGLMLVAKVLQNLANGTVCNEPYMSFINDFLLSQIPSRNHFFEEILQKPNEIDPSSLLQLAIIDVKRQLAIAEVDYSVISFTEILSQNAFKIKKKSRSDGTADRLKKVLTAIPQLQRDAQKAVEERKAAKADTSAVGSSMAPEKPKDPTLWTTQHVQDWLISRGLTEIRTLFSQVDGKLLLTFVNYDAMAVLPELVAQKLPVKKSLKLEVLNLINEQSGAAVKKSGPLPSDPNCWSERDVETWLLSLGLDTVVSTFKSQSITGSTLLKLQEEDLKEIGIVALGTRKKLRRLIDGLAGSSSSSSSRKRSGRRKGGSFIEQPKRASSLSSLGPSLDDAHFSRSLPNIPASLETRREGSTHSYSGTEGASSVESSPRSNLSEDD